MTNTPLTRRILVPLDGGDLSMSALPFLRALATPESEVILLRVVPDGGGLLDRLVPSRGRAEEILQASVSAADEFLADIRDGLHEMSASITSLTRVGHPADEILAVAEELDVSLIIMATNGHGPIGRMVLGSIANRVAHTAEAPVLLFRPDKITLPFSEDLLVPLHRVVVPIDGSGRAREALAPATNIARQVSVPIHLVRVVDVEDHIDLDVDALKAEYGDVMSEISTLQSDMHDELEQEASAIRDRGMDVSTEVLTGGAASGILGLLKAGDMVVMTSHGEGDAGGLFVGSVTEQLIQQSAAPIVLVPTTRRAAIASAVRSGAVPD